MSKVPRGAEERAVFLSGWGLECCPGGGAFESGDNTSSHLSGSFEGHTLLNL